MGGQSHSPFQGSKSLFFARSCSVLHVAALLSCSTFSPPHLLSLPSHKCLVGHKKSLWFLPANEPSYSHTLLRVLTHKHIYTAASYKFPFNNSCTLVYRLFRIVTQYPRNVNLYFTLRDTPAHTPSNLLCQRFNRKTFFVCVLSSLWLSPKEAHT